MEDILTPSQHSQGQRRVVLGGMGGIGKTQLAIAYAMRHNALYDSIFWLNATSEITLKSSLVSIAECILEAAVYEKLSQEQAFLRVRQWLSQPRNTKWLLIYDNYDDPELFDLQQYCPSTTHGSIVITTRLPDRISGQQILVQPLEDISDSLRILESTSQRIGVQEGNENNFSNC